MQWSDNIQNLIFLGPLNYHSPIVMIVEQIMQQ